MITAFLTTLEQMGKIFLFFILGFGLRRLNILPKEVGSSISRLITTLFLPALMLYSNMTEFNLKDIVSYGKLVIIGGLFWGALALLAFPVAKKLAGNNKEEQGIFQYGLTFSNTGAVGVPITLALFGMEGYFKFSLFVLIGTLMTYAWGISLFFGNDLRRSFKQFIVYLLNPVFIFMIIGLLLGMLSAKDWMPTLVVNFVGDLAGCYVPVSLLSIGFAIADYPLGDIIKLPKGYLFTVFRLIVIPALALLAAWVLRLPKSMATMLILTFSNPCGMNVVVYPAAYGRDCKTGANLVLVSSLCSIITVPLLYAFVQNFFH